ncbi:hypothetical protein [Spiroplasma citri]|nr:hypothetical protein [Spiroplasma citri]
MSVCVFIVIIFVIIMYIKYIFEIKVEFDVEKEKLNKYLVRRLYYGYEI